MMVSRLVRTTGPAEGLVCGLLALACLMPMGCVTANVGSQPTAMRAADAVQHPMLAGIPLPRGIAVVDDKSKAHESGRFRFASYEFTGGGSRDALHEFFLHHMPTAGFELLQRRDEAGVYSLYFRSSAEECTIRIGNRGFHSYFTVDVWPLPKGAPKETSDLPPPRDG